MVEKVSIKILLGYSFYQRRIQGRFYANVADEFAGMRQFAR
jgi:hypothetical protein